MQQPKVKLVFECVQSLNDMAVDKNGQFYCLQCQKSLIDFRNRPLKEVLAHTSKNEGCGTFSSEQLEGSMVTLLSVSSLKKYFWALTTFFITETSYAQSDSISNAAKQETVDTPTSACSPGISPVQQEKYTKDEAKETAKVIKAMKRREYKIEYGVFLWRKFPYLVFRQRNYYATRPHSGFWMSRSIEKKPKKNGLVLFTRK